MDVKFMDQRVHAIKCHFKFRKFNLQKDENIIHRRSPMTGDATFKKLILIINPTINK